MSASPEAQGTIGNYVIERPLAHGSMGHVYVARHTLTYARVALKVLREEMAADTQAEERFLREIRAAAQIGHDGIVKVHDAGRTQDGRLYLAMELLRGETLEDRMTRLSGQRLSIMDWLLKALEPLAAAHAEGIVHRDLKPANVFIAQSADGSEHIKLLDFGLARDTRQKSGTETGITLGTPHYMSPEQATKPKLVGPASDVWSMGVMMYEVLSGHMPFDGETLHAVVIQASTEPHIPIAEREPTLDPRLAQLVEACLSKTPGTRPSDAGRLLLLLEPLLRDDGMRRALETPVERQAKGESLTPEQKIPYADTAISSLPLRLYDSSEDTRIPIKRGGRKGVWISTIALVVCALAIVWAFERANGPKSTAQDEPTTPPLAAPEVVPTLTNEADPKSGQTNAARERANTGTRKPRPARPQPSAASPEPSGKATETTAPAATAPTDLQAPTTPTTDVHAATEAGTSIGAPPAQIGGTLPGESPSGLAPSEAQPAPHEPSGSNDQPPVESQPPPGEQPLPEPPTLPEPPVPDPSPAPSVP